MPISDPTRSANMAGKIDLTFGVNGVASIDVPGATGSNVYGVINGPDGTLYVCGDARIQGSSKFFITALNSTGTVISGFGDNGYVIDVFEENEFSHAGQLALTDKKLLLLGSSYIGRDLFPALAQLDLQGNFDPTFGENQSGKIVIHLPSPPGTSSDQDRPDPFTLEATNSGDTGKGSANILADGKVLLSHYFFRPGLPNHGLIIRTHANGSLDTEFAGRGYLTVVAPGFENGQTQVESVSIDTEGRYLVCGGLYDLGSSPLSTFFARYSPEGQPDTSFGPKGFKIIQSPEDLLGGARATALIPLQGGRVLSLGSSVHDPYVGQMLMLKNDGELDPGFNLGKPVYTQLAESSTIWRAFTYQTNEKIVVAGAIDKRKDSFNFDIVIARFNNTGHLDTEFNDGLGWARTRLSALSHGANAVVVQNDKIAIGGVSNKKGIVVRYYS